MRLDGHGSGQGLAGRSAHRQTLLPLLSPASWGIATLGQGAGGGTEISSGRTVTKLTPYPSDPGHRSG